MIRSVLQGKGLHARLVRTSGWVAFGYGASQFVRLASNLILTRVLFPEAFGLMALVTVFLVGLMMFSDVGIGPSIQQSANADDQEFLNTAWTIQVLRGGGLCLFGAVAGPAAAWFYNEPDLRLMLPVASIALLISGFMPTKLESASRHLAIGKVTIAELIAQTISLFITVVLCLVLKTVWALVIGGVLTAAVRVFVIKYSIPGVNNAFSWSREAAIELITFGKWIFLSTACGFLLSQGDKAILGRYLSMRSLGIYNIGYFIGGFPQALAMAIMSKVMIPLYRESHPNKSTDNFHKVQRVRLIFTFTVLTLQFLTSLLGSLIINVLYDARYYQAGAIAVAIACANMPYIIGMSYDYVALSAGDSKRVFYLLIVKTLVQTTFFILGMHFLGLAGALAGLFTGQVLVHPFVARLAWIHGGWDRKHDLACGAAAAIFTTASVIYNWPILHALNELSSFQ